MHKNGKIRRWVSSLMATLMVITMAVSINVVIPEKKAEAAMSNWTDTRSRLGINLEGLSDWSGSMMFADLMKTSRKWGTADAPWVELSASQVDVNGWPTVNDCGVVVIADRAVDVGTYKLSFESNSTNVQITHNACFFTVENVVYGPNNKVTADLVVPANQNNFMISFRNTNGGVRNVTLMRPGYESGSKIFTDEFLKFIEPFSTIRFMDYLSTNGQNTNGDLTQIEWADRKTPSHASQAATIGKAKGGCWEYVVELVNQTGKDAWINIPYNASDDYINKLATFLKQNVNPGINIYVELSNEVWNWSFPQANVNDALAKKDSIANNYYLQYAKQTVNIAKIFRNVYGQSAINENIRVVLAWQIGWYPSDSQPRDMFNYINKHHEAPKNLIYALAGAPYFSEPKPENSTSVTAVHNYMIQSSDDFVDDKKTYIKAALDWGLKGGAVCYEGGPHHQGQVETNLETRMAAHRDAKMQEILVRDLQTNWFDIGGGLFCYFSATGAYNKYGCWALSEKVTDLNTPKYKAIMQLYNENKKYGAVNPSYSPEVATSASPTPTAKPTTKPTATVAPTIKPTTKPGNRKVVFEENFDDNNASFTASNSGDANNKFTIVNDPDDASNKVYKATDTSWGSYMSGNLFTGDASKEYTYAIRVKGDAAILAIAGMNESWEIYGLPEEKKIINHGSRNDGVFSEWKWFVGKISGSASYKFAAQVQANNNVMNATMYVDDIAIYEGDYVDEVKAEVGVATPLPTATVKPTEEPTENPTTPPTEAPDAGLEAAKGAAIKVIEGYYKPENYREEQRAELQKAIDEAKAAINAATDVASVQAAMSAAITSVGEIKTDAQLTEEEIAMVKKVKFTKKKIKIKARKKFTVKIKLTPSAGLTKAAKNVKWSIDKKGKKVIKFVKKAKKLKGKLKAKVKALKKGTAKITCKAPSGKKAVCKIVVK